MTDQPAIGLSHPLETFMRFVPVAAALSLALAITASASFGEPRAPAPRAAGLIAQGDELLASGDKEEAVSAYESALAVDPGYTPILLKLGKAARANGLQGKAIRYYRMALAREPNNVAALAGEGEALAEKGAIEKAKRNLAEVRKACGNGECSEARELAAAIASGPKTYVAAADDPASDSTTPKTN